MILDNIAVTNTGRSLIASAAGGGGMLTVTRCSVGSGSNSAAPSAMTGLQQTVGDYEVISVTASGDEVEITVQETPQSQSYYLRELGIFAKVRNGSEVLLAASTDTSPGYIDANAATVSERLYIVKILVSGAANVVAQFEDRLYAPASHVSDKNNPHGVTLSQLGVTVSAAMLNAMDSTYVKVSQKNKANGVAGLDASGKLPASLLPSSALGGGGWTKYTVTASSFNGNVLGQGGDCSIPLSGASEFMMRLTFEASVGGSGPREYHMIAFGTAAPGAGVGVTYHSEAEKSWFPWGVASAGNNQNVIMELYHYTSEDEGLNIAAHAVLRVTSGALVLSRVQGDGEYPTLSGEIHVRRTA